MSKDNTTVFLIRHGDIANPKKVFYGRTIDVELTEKGRLQIKNLALRIKKLGYEIDRIYCSPLKRTVDSSFILASQFKNPPIETIEGLNEVDIPALVGKPATIRAKIHAKGVDEYEGEFVKLGNE